MDGTSDLERRLWDRMGLLRQRLQAGMQGGLQTLDALELSVPQAMALFRLVERGPLSVGELQEVTGRSQAATSHLVAQLEGRGLASRKSDAEDARRTLVHATKAAREMAGKVEGLRLRTFSSAVAGVPKAALSRLDAALAEVLAAMEASR